MKKNNRKKKILDSYSVSVPLSDRGLFISWKGTWSFEGVPQLRISILQCPLHCITVWTPSAPSNHPFTFVVFCFNFPL